MRGTEVSKLLRLTFVATSMRYLLLLMLFGSHFANCQFTLETELGFPIPGYNKIRVPNEATEFDFNSDFSLDGLTIPGRARLTYTFGEKNNISALFAPLTINYKGASPRDIEFQQTLFSEGEDIEGEYKFNSYRLTYRRDIVKNEKWLFGIGFTAKIRDATIALSSENKKDRKDDIGFVPLLRLVAAYKYQDLEFIIEGDGLAGGPGRAFDFFGGVNYNFYKNLSGKIGYRIVEGGANVSEVYNFTIINIITAGLILEF